MLQHHSELTSDCGYSRGVAVDHVGVSQLGAVEPATAPLPAGGDAYLGPAGLQQLTDLLTQRYREVRCHFRPQAQQAVRSPEEPRSSCYRWLYSTRVRSFLLSLDYSRELGMPHILAR